MKKISNTAIVAITTVLFFQTNVSAQQHYVIDRSFGETCGISVITGSTGTNPNEIFKMSNGKYIIAGDAYNGSLNAYLILTARFNNDGTIDSAFGTNGMVQYTFNQRNTVSCAVMSNDKIYVTGYEAPGNGFSSFRAYVAKFNADGTPDTSFNSSGRVVESTSTNPVSCSFYTHLIVQPDGKVVAFGYESANINGGNNIAMARRYNVNGSADSTFHPSVTYTGFTLPAGTFYSPGILNADGSMRFLYVSSLTNNPVITVKLDSLGEPDSTYGINGMNTTSINSSPAVNRYFADQHENIYAQVLITNATQDIRVLRLDSAGNADSTFSTDGVLDLIDYPGTNLSETGYVIHLDSLDRLWSMGAGSFAFTEPKGIIYRYDTTGAYDSTLDHTGYMAITEYPYTTFRNAFFENDNEMVINTITNGELALLKLKLNTSVVVTISNSGNDTICSGDQTVLSVDQPTTCYSYQWKKDGSNFANLNDTTITVDSTGSYQLVAIAGSDTITSQSVNITVVICSSVSEVSGQNLFSMYPNPATTELIIHPDNYTGNYVITDLTGRVLLNIENNNSQTMLRVSLADFNSGTYLLMSDNKLQVKEFTVIK